MATRNGMSNGFGQGALESGHYGHYTAKLLQHDDWRRDALRQSEVRRALRGSVDAVPAAVSPVGAGRVGTAASGLLVRLGSRLRSGRQAILPTPAC